MHMVGHEHIGVNVTAFAQRDLAQFIPIAVVVDRVEEAGLPVVAALNDVLGNTSQIQSGLSRHDAKQSGRRFRYLGPGPQQESVGGCSRRVPESSTP